MFFSFCQGEETLFGVTFVISIHTENKRKHKNVWINIIKPIYTPLIHSIELSERPFILIDFHKIISLWFKLDVSYNLTNNFKKISWNIINMLVKTVEPSQTKY